MAKLFPALDPAEINNPGERTVARALVERLPNRVEVFHGFNWLSRTRAGTIMEGESAVSVQSSRTDVESGPSVYRLLRFLVVSA
ncbi:hypothetical protein [Candidatus Rariloculus sp.]|uniref:hypothetical protein n=1 Tax=Candidatus Rariloculus sp. TaxID=3101265 RepID=UPI003D11D6EB